MTIQETIQMLERMIDPDPWESDLSDKAKEALNVALEALEKQVPKRPGKKKLIDEKLFGNNPVYIIPCSRCGSAINITHLFCPWCGQAIDNKE